MSLMDRFFDFLLREALLSRPGLSGEGAMNPIGDGLDTLAEALQVAIVMPLRRHSVQQPLDMA